MTQIIKIGNSQGIRIPKPIIELTNLEGQELEFTVLNEGLLITPEKKSRAGWRLKTNRQNFKTSWSW
jgi:antitoxin MazE